MFGGLRRVVRFLMRPRTLAVLACGMVLLGGGWLWLRQSSLVAIRQVTIIGLSGPNAGSIRTALRDAATGMTTLDLNEHELDRAVRRWPQVTSLSAQTEFPHGLRIVVDEYLPVAEVLVSGRPIYVSADGVLLHDGSGPMRRLPVIPLSVPPGGPTVTDEPGALAAVRVLAAAPWQMLAHIAQATDSAAHGVIVSLRAGPQVYFGDGSELHAKWAATLAVLASPSAAAASYIDVTAPQRPAAGVPVSGGAGAAIASGVTASTPGTTSGG